MSKRKSVRFVARCTVLALAVGTVAAYTTYSKRSMRAYAAPSEPAEPQTANREGKSDRLALLVPASLTWVEPRASYALASAPTMPEVTGALAFAAPVLPKEEAAPPVAPAAPKQAALTPPPRNPAAAHDKPKHAPPSPTSGILDDNQIAGLKGRLRLTEEQAEYWPAVEEALRDVVRTQFRGRNFAHSKPSIDLNSPEVQKLIWAAMPLLMRLREDQKGEVRKLARVIGLEQVASQI